jgi:hypothetical protein
VLDGYVLYDNAPMLRLLRSSGRPLEVQWADCEVLSVQMARCSACIDRLA